MHVGTHVIGCRYMQGCLMRLIAHCVSLLSKSISELRLLLQTPMGPSWPSASTPWATTCSIFVSFNSPATHLQEECFFPPLFLMHPLTSRQGRGCLIELCKYMMVVFMFMTDYCCHFFPLICLRYARVSSVGLQRQCHLLYSNNYRELSDTERCTI